MSRIIIGIVVSAAMLIIFPQISGTADAGVFCGGQVITGSVSGNSAPVGNPGGSHGRTVSCAGRKRDHRISGRSERDPPDRVRGKGRKTAGSRRSGRGKKKRKAGQVSEEAAAAAGSKSRKKQRGGKKRASEDDVIVVTERPDDVPFLTGAMMRKGVRVLTLTEFVVRRSPKNDKAGLGGLHPENRRKETDRPTAERLLKAFSDITLIIVKKGESVTHHLTPLSEVQKEILERSGLNPSLYEYLEINKSPPQLTE